ncbi:TetR/AcrR family transcriptional regulator [Enteractinococcus fodinae]|uniref:AcrR family transcriptional regulator n=1 Tax=Enteractinococcus fodinae TaxID=684663 RepID=A0ABU2AXJ6_9MICC|nr:TetR/AcrR family transcriptional regulator [Enteractinococcus fodinae]MDR7346075.1 AcrR family transcriptional regulator [Enteractinococcus fodinae]
MDNLQATAPRTARELAHAEMQERILTAAREQLKSVGPAQLSLRAIARELGVVSSAIYRYVASRDELITRLILQSFHDVADAVGAACQRADPAPEVQLQTWSQALRDWALQHPYDWALIYGVPIPGYAAPEETIEPARRVNESVLQLYPQLRPNVAPGPVLDASEQVLEPLRSALAEQGEGVHGAATALMLAWSSIHGFITLELGGHFEGSAEDTEPVFAALVAQLASQLLSSESNGGSTR